MEDLYNRSLEELEEYKDKIKKYTLLLEVYEIKKKQAEDVIEVYKKLNIGESYITVNEQESSEEEPRLTLGELNITPYTELGIQIDESEVKEGEVIYEYKTEQIRENAKNFRGHYNARMVERGYGDKHPQFIVLKGSKIAEKPSESAHRTIKRYRKKHQDLIGDDYILKEDITFRSGSGAAGFVGYTNINGNDVWKDVETGQSLGEILNKREDEF